MRWSFSNRTFAAVSAFACACGLAPFALQGCGGDDTEIATADGGGADTSVDGSHADVTGIDANGKDVQVVDGGGVDASDGSLPFLDANSFDAPPIQQFPAVVNQLVCQRLGECCAYDGGPAFDQAGCEALYGGSVGFEYVGQYLPFPNDAGNVVYNTMLAAQCMAAARGISCGVVNAAELIAFRQYCTGALQGTLGLDAGCTSTVECAQGYCNYDVDGGQKCTPLQGIGGDCNQNYDEACADKGLGRNPPNYCAQNDAGVYGCAAPLPNGADCFTDQACSTGLCVFLDPNPTGLPGKCGTTEPLTDPGVFDGGFCEGLAIKDAGGGG
jgi:hypothetical protein